MRRFVLAAALAVATALPAAADELGDLVQQYVNLPANQQMIDSMLSPEMLAQQFSMGLPPDMEVSDEKITQIGALLSSEMQKLRPDMMEAMANAMAAHFTKEEISALMAFYQDEHGASAMAKMQPYMADFTAQIMPKFAEMQQAILPDIIALLQDQ